ncbi:MAG: DUF6689 family protein [Pseudomarimonas sp.]
MSVARMLLPTTLFVLIALVASPVQADVVVTIIGDVATAAITVEEDDETYTATLRLEFQQPQNLTEACLGISAAFLDAAAIAAVDARLPDPLGQQIDEDFPILVTVEPPPGCGLSFVNEVQFALTTSNLQYTDFSPYRIMKGPIAAPFADVTAAIESGSIRARGRGGAFSEFVIVEDINQDFSLDASELLADLADELDDPDIALTARTALEAELAVVESAFRSGQIASARQALLGFESDLRAFSGVGVPNGYAPDLGLTSEIGELLGLSGALGFQLARLDGVP